MLKNIIFSFFSFKKIKIITNYVINIIIKAITKFLSFLINNSNNLEKAKM